MQFPRILIFGQPFNNYSGGGITLTNLFKGWPKEKIAVTFIGHGLFHVATDVCDTYYQLGSEEHRWIFPFNLVQRKFKSGVKLIDNQTATGPVNFIQKGCRYKIVNKFFYPALRWTGIFHSASKISLSEKFQSWLGEFKPDILYLQPSTRETILFASDLCDYLKIPSVIHIMDDWPSAIRSKGLLRNYWGRKIDIEFKELLQKASLHLSIGEAMSKEYYKRYGLKFIPFNNPIDIDRWLPYTKKKFTINPEHVSILYSGRIGDNGITDSLYEIADAIDVLENKEFNIKFHIQTPTKENDILNRLREFRCVIINAFAKYDQIPSVFSNADILILANDFSSEGINYLRLSMPTKASEYMISGTPVMVYASGNTAVSEFFKINNCGYCVTKQEQTEIQKAIMYLIMNKEARITLSQNAVQLACEKFSAQKVRQEFQKLLNSLTVK